MKRPEAELEPGRDGNDGHSNHYVVDPAFVQDIADQGEISSKPFAPCPPHP